VRAKVKYLAIYRHREKYSITAMCAFFEVSRSGYYGFVKRMDKPEFDQNLANDIAECQEKTRKTYGYRRVHIWLMRNKGIYKNPKTILRVMQKYGLLSEIRRRRKYKHMGQQVHKYANILNRNFHADKPNQKWVTDISYIHTQQGVLYLSMIRDLFDNSIVAYKTSSEQTVGLVLDTIRAAKKKEAVTAELQLHSDQGFQYTSHGYFNLTQSYNITPSMSRRGNCYDNAPAENFFGILKSECIKRQKIKDFAVAKSLIDGYIYFYNHERIQLKTKLTPLETRRQCA
jgi:transposase InsO family protein